MFPSCCSPSKIPYNIPYKSCQYFLPLWGFEYFHLFARWSWCTDLEPALLCATPGYDGLSPDCTRTGWASRAKLLSDAGKKMPGLNEEIQPLGQKYSDVCEQRASQRCFHRQNAALCLILRRVLSAICSHLGESGPIRARGWWQGLCRHMAELGPAASRRKKGGNSGRQLLGGEAVPKNRWNFIGSGAGLFGKGDGRLRVTPGAWTQLSVHLGRIICAFIWPWEEVCCRVQGRLCATILELSHIPLCEILWQFTLPWVIVSLKLITGKGSQRGTEVVLCYLCLTGLLMSVTTEVSSSRNVILGFGCWAAGVCSAFVSSQAETQHCQVVSQLTMSVLKGFGYTLIHLYNRVRARKDWGMFLRNQFSGHMSTKSLLN